MHKGVGVGIELLIQLSPRPTPFSDREDDASSINCFRIVDWLVEKRESRQLHPSRCVASNISPRLDIVAMVRLTQLEVRCLGLFGKICAAAFFAQRLSRIVRPACEYIAKRRRLTICQ